jgi:hypothetical protein
VACYQRDQKIILDGTTGHSRRTTQAIYFDKWSIMDVALAKAPFTDTTTCKMFVYVEEELGCLGAMYKTKLEDASQTLMPTSRLSRPTLRKIPTLK